jgi:AIPR protein
MVIVKFYNIINEELSLILKNNPSDEKMHKHKNEVQNKGYALLVWFLQFYGQKDLYQSFITDGTDDSSCDIIFMNKNAQDEPIFYVIQSKYVHFDATKKKEAAFPKIEKEEFNSTLHDFSLVLSGARKVGKNKSFNQKYEALKKHLEENGKVKFIFFTLAATNEAEVNHAVAAFNQNYAPNITLEVIDIDKIRRDYIEFKYKEIKTANPLEYAYSSEDSTIELPIERFKDSKRDIFEFEGRAKAFTLLIKPKTVHELFKKYRFSLFFKNVRNPIHRSNYNQKIIDTLLKKPDSFWYFNNGITAITKILPDIGIHAKKIEIEGLQIINGAQTVYSIFSAYENATAIQRKAMDAYAKIALRLIGSSDEEFNLQITRYTNLQNPMHDRDFWANDDVQQTLQNESFYTDIWYEKRRDEFRLSEEKQEALGIRVVTNEDFALAYVAFHLQKPMYAMMRQGDFFISRKDDANGLYEEIFDKDIVKFEDMYASLFMLNTLKKILTIYLKDESYSFITVNISSPVIVAISKIVAEKYFAITRPNESGKIMNISRHILEISKTRKEKDIIVLKKILKYSFELLVIKITNKNLDKLQERMQKLVTTTSFYDALSEKIQEEDLDIAAIQAIELDEK